MKAAISISYPANHKKGDRQIIDGAEHAAMLHGIVKRYREEVDWPIFICCTSFVGLAPYNYSISSEEKEILWKLFAMPDVFFVSVSDVTGHMEGGHFSIYQGLLSARAMDCDYLIHAAEDVIPERGICDVMFSRMTIESLVYIGAQWRQNEVATQFFGCNVPWFLRWFNGHGSLEGRFCEAYITPEVLTAKHSIVYKCYLHTHTPSEFMKWLEE